MVNVDASGYVSHHVIFAYDDVDGDVAAAVDFVGLLAVEGLAAAVVAAGVVEYQLVVRVKLWLLGPGLKHLDLHLLWRVKLIKEQEVVVPVSQPAVVDVQQMWPKSVKQKRAKIKF